MASKAALRSALDEFLTNEQSDQNLFYFPSCELALQAFERPFMEDRRHIHKHVLDFIMTVFEQFYCQTGLDDETVMNRFRAAQELDKEVARNGHWAVPRVNLLFHPPPSAAKSDTLDEADGSLL
jgi:hypothetical protein